MRKMEHMFIGGQWRRPASNEVIEVINAGNESLLRTVPIAGPADVDAAVEADRQALKDW